MKRLYDENDKHLPETAELSQIVRQSGLVAAFEWAHARGYSFRDVSHFIHGEVIELELMGVLEKF